MNWEDFIAFFSPLPGRVRCLSPTPFPRGFGTAAMLLPATCRHRDVARSRETWGGRPPHPSPWHRCKEPSSVHQLLHISISLHCGNARGVAAGKKKKTWSEVEWDVCPKHDYLGTCNWKENGTVETGLWGQRHCNGGRWFCPTYLP